MAAADRVLEEDEIPWHEGPYGLIVDRDLPFARQDRPEQSRRGRVRLGTHPVGIAGHQHHFGGRPEDRHERRELQRLRRWSGELTIEGERLLFHPRAACFIREHPRIRERAVHPVSVPAAAAALMRCGRCGSRSSSEAAATGFPP